MSLNILHSALVANSSLNRLLTDLIEKKLLIIVVYVT